MSMTSSRPYIARALYEWILDNNSTPYIMVDATVEGVVVPEEFVNDGQIVLNIAPQAVRALEIGNETIFFSGRFGGDLLDIFVPIGALMAIYARENGQGMVFEVEPATAVPQEDQEVSPLTVVESSQEDKREENGKKRAGKPHLTVVK